MHMKRYEDNDKSHFDVILIIIVQFELFKDAEEHVNSYKEIRTSRKY